MKSLTLFLVLLINVVYGLSGTVYKVTGIDSGYILGVRDGPSNENEIVGKLKNDQLIFSTSTSDGWAKYYKGYVEMTYLTVASNAINCTTADMFNFRVGPSASYYITTTLDKGTEVKYYGTDPLTKNWAVTNQGYIISNCLSGLDGSSSDCSGGYIVNQSINVKNAERAADYAREHVNKNGHDSSVKYISNALMSAGFVFHKPNTACQFHTDGILKKMGFTLMPSPKKFKKGDIAVHGCNGANKNGHIQIYDGNKWYSDTVQNNLNIYGKNFNIYRNLN